MTISKLVLLCVLCGKIALAQTAPNTVFYQAHRGGMNEVPENTLTAFRHAWSCPGAVPETDICATRDGVFVCMHDDTPERTTTGPDALRKKRIGELSLDELRQCDAGVKFAPQYAGEKVPTLTEVFDLMKDHPERQIYLDLKVVDLDKLKALIDRYGLVKQIIFVHGMPAMCKKLQTRFPGARTMTWLSGSPEQIKRGFDKLAQTHFDGISQLQFHLKSKQTHPAIEYVLDADFLKSAVAQLQAAGAVLQLRPFDYDHASLQALVDLGVHWFVTDEPKRFSNTLSP
jgi:glycerophosphoryl diester phosphodiesterase